MAKFAELQNLQDFQKKRNRGRVDLTLSGQMFRSLDFRQRGFKNTLLFANKDMEKRAFKHDTGVGKLPVRPFFSIGRKEEGKIRAEFNKFYFILNCSFYYSLYSV